MKLIENGQRDSSITIMERGRGRLHIRNMMEKGRGRLHIRNMMERGRGRLHIKNMMERPCWVLENAYL